MKPLTGEKFDTSRHLLIAEWFGLSNFKIFNRLREPISTESLTKNPSQVEFTEANIIKLENELLPICNSNISKARREIREFMKIKFFPMSLRSRVWEKLIHNIAGITKKMYTMYCEYIQKHRSGGIAFGSQSIIESSISEYSIESNIVITDDIKESVVKMMLVFEYLHPDIGYVIGMERVAFFIRSMVGIDEDTGFFILYNLYFSCDFLWTTLSAEASLLNHYLMVLKALVDTYTNFKEMYAINRQHFERFFMESSQTLFVGILAPDIIEKMIDHLVIWDDSVLFAIMLKIVQKFDNFDMSPFSYSRAKVHIFKAAKEIPEAEYIKAILTANANHKDFRDIMTNKVKS